MLATEHECEKEGAHLCCRCCCQCRCCWEPGLLLNARDDGIVCKAFDRVPVPLVKDVNVFIIVAETTFGRAPCIRPVLALMGRADAQVFARRRGGADFGRSFDILFHLPITRTNIRCLLQHSFLVRECFALRGQSKAPPAWNCANCRS